MALKKDPGLRPAEDDISLSGQKAKKLFTAEKKEGKTLTTFSIEPSFKKELEEMFDDMGLSWAAGIRFVLREFYKKQTAGKQSQQ